MCAGWPCCRGDIAYLWMPENTTVRYSRGFVRFSLHGSRYSSETFRLPWFDWFGLGLVTPLLKAMSSWQNKTSKHHNDTISVQFLHFLMNVSYCTTVLKQHTQRKTQNTTVSYTSYTTRTYSRVVFWDDFYSYILFPLLRKWFPPMVFVVSKRCEMLNIKNGVEMASGSQNVMKCCSGFKCRL